MGLPNEDNGLGESSCNLLKPSHFTVLGALRISTGIASKAKLNEVYIHQ